jgi:hypothetical protein
VTKSIHVRLDPDAARALDIIRNGQMSDSEAVRVALRETAERRLTRSALRAEVERLNQDEDDRREMQEVLTLMEELAPDWPE